MWGKGGRETKPSKPSAKGRQGVTLEARVYRILYTQTAQVSPTKIVKIGDIVNTA